MKFLLSTIAVIVFVVLVANAAVSPEQTRANEAARIADQRKEAEEAAKTRKHAYAVDRCMGPDAEHLRTKDYSAMLDACERENVEFNPQVHEEVERRIADERGRIMDRQDRERAAEKQQLQPSVDQASPDGSEPPRPAAD